MKVLIVCQYFPPEPFRVGDLAVALQQHDCDVTVLTGFPNYPQGKIYKGHRIQLFKRENFNGVSVIRVPLYPDTSHSKIKRILNYVSYAISASILGPVLVKPNQYDLIITFQLSPVTIGLPSVVIKKLHNSTAPIYFWIQDIWPESLEASGFLKKGFLFNILQKIVNFLYHQSDKILVQSEGFIPKVLRYGIPREKIEFFPNWAEDLYQPLNPDTDLAKQEGMLGFFNVVFAGNIGKAQDLETLLEAARMLSSYVKIKIFIFGDGSNLEKLKQQAEGLNNIYFKGRHSVEKMPHYFALADALLVQLKHDPLFAMTIPSKIQSYLACGRPVIAGLQGSGAKIIEEAQAGIVCEPENPESLYGAIVKLYTMPPEQRLILGKNARKYYDIYFSRSSVINRLVELIKKDVDTRLHD